MLRDEAGFTLVEVIVAFAVVVLVLASIYQAVAGAYRGEARAQVRDRALAQARTHLEVIGIEQPFELGETTGTYVTGVAWRLTITPVEALAYKGQAFRILLEPLDHRGHPLLRLETFKLRPRPQEER
jgi:prepilin-type N-terminal cleavage/methylation domain-containing protein